MSQTPPPTPLFTNSEAHPLQYMSPPLFYSPHPVHRSHLLAEDFGLYQCQTGIDVLTCARGVERDQGTAVRTGKSAAGFSCRTDWSWLCWKNRALLFMSLCLLSSCLSVRFTPACLHPSTSHSPSASHFLSSLSLCHSSVLCCMATWLPLAPSSFMEC